LEMQPRPYEDYVSRVKNILTTNPSLRIYVQTDQYQFLEYFIKNFGTKIVFVEELPTTTSDIPIHKIFEGNKIQFGQYLLACVEIMAKCKYLVTHTGNLAFWTALRRGNFYNSFQL